METRQRMAAKKLVRDGKTHAPVAMRDEQKQKT